MSDEKEQAGLFETIDAEKVKELYFNEELIQPNYELFRLNTPKGRIYFRPLDENAKTFAYYGGTGNLTSEIPKDDNLIEWMAHKGVTEAKRYYYLRMLFGSLEHTLLAELCIMGEIDLDSLPARLRNYFFTQSFYCTEKELSDLATEAQKDVIGMMQWMIDHKAKLAFVELPVYSDGEGLATQIDIGAFIEIEVGSGKNYKIEQCFALINYKSGKGGFFKEHRFQLEVERRIFIDCYPEFTEQDIRIFNLSGTNWRSTEWNRKTRPYKFSEQTDKADIDRYNHYLELGKITRDERLAKPLNLIQGKVGVGITPASCVVSKTLKEVVEEGIWKRFVKTSAAIPDSLLV